MDAKIPLWLKLAFTAFVLVWVPVYVRHLGPQNFLWLCDIANLLILAGLWFESRLLLTSQLISVLAIGIVWSLDLAGALLFGVHPLGATEYMFNPEIALHVRLLSLFHGGVWPIVAYAVYRVGYDLRGWRLQVLICWLVLPATFVLTEPHRVINWVWGPFGSQQTWVPAWAYLLLCMLAYPIIVYLPTHEALKRMYGLSANSNRSSSER